MGRRARLAAIGAALGLAALAAFAVPTVWGKPWSIDHFFLRVVLRFGLESPMLLSRLRLLEPYGLRFHNDELDDFSVDSTRSRAERVRAELRVLRRYDRKGLSPERRRSYDVMAWYLDTLVAGEPYVFHDLPLNQLEGVHTALPDFMLNGHVVEDERSAVDYVKRLEAFGPTLAGAVESVRYRAGRGVVPPRFVLARVRDQLEKLIAGAPGDHVLVTHLAEVLEPLGLRPAREQALLRGAREAVAGVVIPAYGRMLDLLDELEPQATDAAGVWRLPDGEAYYAWALRFHTTTDRSADEIHATGIAETARIQDLIRRLLRLEGLSAADLPVALRDLHRDPRYLFPDTDAGRAQILAGFRSIVEQARGRLPAYFGRLPVSSVVVEAVPAFKQDGAPGAYYWPPALDGSRPGTFYVNLRSVDEVVRFGMRTLAYHEAVPGHHLQLALAFENTGLPLFRRLIPFGAFVEGWALYAERLALEEGFHETTLDRIGALVAELFRAVRLVVDTGIHAKRWTREEAIDYMLENTGMPEGDVVAEVERYVVRPGQACAYKMGQLRILELRRRAQAALGEDFDLREFHDLVLGGGSLPLVLLEEEVESWLAARTAP